MTTKKTKAPPANNPEEASNIIQREASMVIRGEGDDREVELTASTETAVLEYCLYNDRYQPAYRILDHSEGSVDLSRAADGLVVTDNHYGDQIGLLQPVTLKAKKIKGKVRWSRSERAEIIKNDALDGIRRNVSIDGEVNEASYKLDGERDGYPILRAMKWTPHRVAFVSLGADPKSGVGREQKNIYPGDKTMADEIKREELEARDKRIQELEREVAESRKAAADEAEGKISKAIIARDEEVLAMNTLAAYHRLKPEVLEGALSDHKTLREFREIALQAVKDNKVVVGNQVGNGQSPELTPKEAQKYSMLRAIRSLIPDERVGNCFEREISEEVAKAVGKSPQGLYIPSSVLNRTLKAGETGANVIATELMTGDFIELLRNRMALTALGARVMAGLEGDISIPGQLTSGTSYWVAEGNAPTASNATLRQVAGTPHCCGAYTDVTRKLLRQASLDVEAFITDDLVKTVALAVDLAGIRGSGMSGQPLGLVNRLIADSVSAISISGSNTPTYAEYAKFEAAIEGDNADIGAIKWLIDAGAKAHARTTDKSSSTAQFILEPGNTILGYPTVMSNQLDSKSAVFGVWDQLVIGMWGAMDVTVDPYALSTSGGVRIIVLQDVDVMIRQIKCFAYNIGHMGAA